MDREPRYRAVLSEEAGGTIADAEVERRDRPSVEPDEVHDVDPDAPLDLTGDELVDAWRGVKAEDDEEVTGGLAGLLRSRSRALLGDLAAAAPPRGRSSRRCSSRSAPAAQLAVPWLIQHGIDNGIPPLLDGGSGTHPPARRRSCSACWSRRSSRAVTFNAFLLLLGRVGQDVVLDIRRRLFLHFQRLSTAFHERYTSGRVISRQTSDVEAIADLLGDGLINLITSVLLIGRHRHRAAAARPAARAADAVARSRSCS